MDGKFRKSQNGFGAAHVSRFTHNWFTDKSCCRMENKNVRLTKSASRIGPCLDLASCQRIRKEISHMTKNHVQEVGQHAVGNRTAVPWLR